MRSEAAGLVWTRQFHATNVIHDGRRHALKRRETAQPLKHLQEDREGELMFRLARLGKNESNFGINQCTRPNQLANNR